MKLVANNLYRGPRPSSFSELQSAGIKTVINLQSGAYELFHDDSYEREDASDFGIVEHNINLSAIAPPAPWQVKKVIRAIMKSEGLVYIHCRHGVDRTGYMCAAYRILVCDWHVADAIEELYENGFHRWAYFWWPQYLWDYEDKDLGDL